MAEANVTTTQCVVGAGGEGGEFRVSTGRGTRRRKFSEFRGAPLAGGRNCEKFL